MRSGKLQVATLQKAFDWLHDLYMSPIYSNVKDFYALLPEEIWKRYELFEVEGLREQVLLDDASRKLLQVWRSKRPVIFNKDKKREQTTNSSHT